MKTTSSLAIPIALVGLALLFPISSRANSPSGLAGKMETALEKRHPHDTTGIQKFEWYSHFGHHELGDTSSLTVDFAIIPFDSSETLVGLDEIDGRTFLGITFKEDMVNEALPFNPGDWNCVRIELDFAQQNYMLSVNGVVAGPFDFLKFSTPPYRSMSVQAIRVNRFSNRDSVLRRGWIDELTVSRISSDVSTTLLDVPFDVDSSYLCSPGTLVPETPPSTAQLPEQCPTAIAGADGSDAHSSSPSRALVAGNPSPQPSTGEISIPYHLKSSADVQLEIQDVTGAPVFRSQNTSQEAGEYMARWDGEDMSGRDLPNGTYFYRIRAGDCIVTGKLLLTR